MFAKKSTNAINIISGIAVFGIAVGSGALVLVLSVFNGFEDLITGMYNNFNPDVKILPAKGKTFEPDTISLEKIKSLNGVSYVSEVLEEVALFDHKGNQYLGIIKGVDDQYRMVSNIDVVLREGKYVLKEEGRNTVVVGLGMRNKLGINIDDPFSPISIYMPKARKGAFDTQPFYRQFIFPRGTFNIQTDFDNTYVISSLGFTRELLRAGNMVSALEIKLNNKADKETTISEIRNIMGPKFKVKDRDQQEESFFRLMKMEKWLSFAIVGLMMIMIAFNLIGALWMIVLDKKRDIAILKSMGAQNQTIQNIFLGEGFLLCSLGLILGFIGALLLFAIQKSVGLVAIPGNLIIEAYPISLRFPDFLLVAITVFAIGLVASYLPSSMARKVPAIILEE